MKKQESMLFPLNLQFFADGSETSAETKNTEQQTETTAGQQSNKSQDEIMIPKTRFDEVNTRFKDVQKQLDDLMREKQEREQAEAEKHGEFQEYKTKAETHEQRVQQLEGVINQLLEVKLEGIPEELRDLIPSNFTVEQKLEWIATAEKKGLFTVKPNKPIGGLTNPAGQGQIDLSSMTTAELLRLGYSSKTP